MSTNESTLQYLAAGIRQLSAAAACAQIEMRVIKREMETEKHARRARHGRAAQKAMAEAAELAPLAVLDELANELAAPYLTAITRLGNRLHSNQ